MKQSSILNAGKWTARLLLLALVAVFSLGIPTAKSRAADDPTTPHKVFLPVTLRLGPGFTPLAAQCVDCPRNIFGLTGRTLRMDNTYHPHIAYGNDHLYHAWNDGSGWKTEVVDPAPGVGYMASLAFDNSGKPGISYYDDYNHRLKLARWSGTAWTLQVVDSAPFSGYTSSLAFNSAGSPRIAYLDYDSVQSIFHIKYAEYNGSAWTIFPMVDHTEEYTGTTLSLALDPGGGTHISYWINNFDGGGLMYASWVNGAWNLQTVEDDPEIGRDNSLAFDGLGKAHISYFDDWDGLVKYASLSGAAWTTETVFGENLAMDRNNATSLAFDSSNNPMIAFSLGSDPRGTLAWFAYKTSGVWHVNQEHDIVGAPGARWSSIAVDASGKPHISYVSYATGELHYTSLTAWNPDAWSDAAIDSGAQVGQGASLAMDRFGRPHIAYMDLTHNVMKYATLSLGVWKTMPVNVPGIAPAHGHSLAVDSTGTPHIAYADTSLQKIMYATLNGASWTVVPVADDTGADIEKYISLAFDASDKPYISFHDASFAEVDLKYAHKVSGIWTVSVVDKNPVGITGLYNLIAIDSSGNPHISYYNNYKNSLWYASLNGASWDKVQVDAVGAGGFYTSLALDSLNHPHICHSDEINYDVKYATYNGSAWSYATLTPADPGHTDLRDTVCSIKIGSGNVPYVSYFDKIDRHLAIAHPTGGVWSSEVVDASGDNGEQNSLAMFNGAPYIAYYTASSKDLLFMLWKP